MSHRCPRCGSNDINGGKYEAYFELSCGACKLYEGRNSTEADFIAWSNSWSVPPSPPVPLRTFLGRRAGVVADEGTPRGLWIDTDVGQKALWRLIAWLPHDVASVVLLPEERRFAGDSLAELKQWANVLELEDALAHPDDQTDLVRIVPAFRDYHVFLCSGTLLTVPVWSPAGALRYLAICTAPDAAQAFLASAGMAEDTARTKVVRREGRELFAELRACAGELGIVGLVFNPSGPDPALYTISLVSLFD